MIKILVCGSRDFVDTELIEQLVFVDHEDFTCIIEGGARGADTIAQQLAFKYGMACLHVEANWAKYGRAAGPIRNKWMLEFGQPDIVYAFHTNKALSKGTNNMVNQAINTGITVVEVTDTLEIV